MEIEQLSPYIRFKTSRSGGSGGQHVNKVSSKVALLFDVWACSCFTEEEKARIQAKLAARFQSEGMLQVISQESRSQLENKEIALEKLEHLLKSALKTDKPRKKTKPSKRSNQKRLDSKRQHALKKINRRSLD